MEHDTGNVLTQKVGPLPLVVWVVGASGVVFLFLLMKGKGSANTAANNQTNQVSALAPTEAEAFGTIEQQQQDVTNALTTLGNNQSALGGSMSTLTGIVTQQGSDNAAAFQNLANGQQTIESGQTSAATNEQNYFNAITASLTNYFNSLSGQVGGVSSQVNGLNSNVIAGNQQLSAQSGAQYTQLLGVLTNPWIKAWYQNQVLSTLTPYQQQQYWIANQQQAAGNPA